VIGISCFVIAPPFRRHGVASALLDRVIAEASARGALWVEGYPTSNPGRTMRDTFAGRVRCTTLAGSNPSKSVRKTP